MPLGNLTSQFFANVYLDRLDKFVKHELKAKYHIRYVDDFILLHESKEQLKKWRNKIEEFLKNKLELDLHKDKSKVLNLSNVIDFIGFRHFYYFKLLRKRGLKKILRKIKMFEKGEASLKKVMESFNGWNVYARWADTLELRRSVLKKIQLVKKELMKKKKQK